MKKKRYRLKTWVKYSLLAITVIPLITFLISINGKMEQDFVNNCEGQGYSHNYCVAHS